MMVLLGRIFKIKNHLSLDERFDIENELNKNLSFKEISRNIGKNCTTISRKIKNHYTVKNTSGIGRKFNNCIFRNYCPKRSKYRLNNCDKFKEEKLRLLNKPPYVCNGCKCKHQCTLTKHFYDAAYANNEYLSNLYELKSGVIIYQDEIDNLNNILTPLIKEQNQSIHQALLNNKNKIMFSEKKYTNILI